jgi:hypothetical protein
MYDLNKKPPEKNHANSNMHSACVRFLSSSNRIPLLLQIKVATKKFAFELAFAL